MDPVGAGDGFAVGIISGILKQESLKQTVKRANAIGAMVMKVKGDFEGLPNSAAIENFMGPVNEWKDIKR